MTSKGVFTIDQKTFDVIDLKLSFSRSEERLVGRKFSGAGKEER